MSRRCWAIVNTILFSILVPGTVAILIPRWLLGGFARPINGPLTWIGGTIFAVGTPFTFAAPGNLRSADWAHPPRSRLRNTW